MMCLTFLAVLNFGCYWGFKKLSVVRLNRRGVALRNLLDFLIPVNLLLLCAYLTIWIKTYDCKSLINKFPEDLLEFSCYLLMYAIVVAIVFIVAYFLREVSEIVKKEKREKTKPRRTNDYS